MITNKDKVLGKILLADNEETFLNSTADLLRREGYNCDCVNNGSDAISLLEKNNYDLLIADIKMPGNSRLELIKHLAQNMPNLNTILITGYPSQQTAIDSINFNVMTYMIKPIDFHDLLPNVHQAVKKNTLQNIISKTKQNLNQWLTELENIEESIATGKADTFNMALKSYLEITTAKIESAFDEIRNTTELFNSFREDIQICSIMKCPSLQNLSKAIKDAIDQIKNTKDTNRSKQLAYIRTKLEKLLGNIQKI